MAKFSMHDFVMKTLTKMKNSEDEYKVRQYALGWYEKDVLTDADMEVIDSWYVEVEEIEVNEEVVDPTETEEPEAEPTEE